MNRFPQTIELIALQPVINGDGGDMRGQLGERHAKDDLLRILGAVAIRIPIVAKLKLVVVISGAIQYLPHLLVAKLVQELARHGPIEHFIQIPADDFDQIRGH